MKPTIICTGDELFGVLTDLDKRGLEWSSCETGVGGNAGYRLHVNFERVAELDPPIAVRTNANGTCCQQVKNPVALTDPTAVKPAQGARNAHVTASVGGSDLSIEDRLSALQERLASTGRLKRRKPTTAARLPYSDE